jgi:predicted regulator of Ras-like GTPase activity (Roadblock/LC7/MglB family)
MADYDSILEAVERDLTGFIGASVVDLDTGMSRASRSAVADFDLDSAHNSQMVKSKFTTMQAPACDSTLEDMLLTLSDQLHLIKVLDNGKTFIYVAATKATTNLALLRRTVDEHTVGC